MKRFSLLVACAGALAAGEQVRADSIWQRANPNAAYLFVDTRARRPGDLLTIVINENTGIDNNDKRAMDKETASGGLFSLKGSSTGGGVGAKASADFNASGSSNRSFTGNAQYQSNRVFSDHLTVTVVDVLPNGNLIIEGSRRVLVSGEERLLRISGVVRPIDIGLGNIVESQYIASFKVSYAGKGQESKFTNHGWFGQAWNYVWPF